MYLYRLTARGRTISTGHLPYCNHPAWRSPYLWHLLSFRVLQLSLWNAAQLPNLPSLAWSRDNFVNKGATEDLKITAGTNRHKAKLSNGFSWILPIHTNTSNYTSFSLLWGLPPSVVFFDDFLGVPGFCSCSSKAPVAKLHPPARRDLHRSLWRKEEPGYTNRDWLRVESTFTNQAMTRSSQVTHSTKFLYCRRF